MKKMMIALVAMFVMTMSANAQSNDNNSGTLTFERMSSYLELNADQIEPVKTAMAQFSSSMEAYHRLQSSLKDPKAWEKIEARHKATMKQILNEKQYDKYVHMLDLTAKNTADRMMNEATAAK